MTNGEGRSFGAAKGGQNGENDNSWFAKFCKSWQIDFAKTFKLSALGIFLTRLLAVLFFVYFMQVLRRNTQPMTPAGIGGAFVSLAE